MYRDLPEKAGDWTPLPRQNNRQYVPIAKICLAVVKMRPCQLSDRFTTNSKNLYKNQLNTHGY
jgi:hypothetical protein